MNIARFGPPGLKWFSGNFHPRPHGRGYYMTARRAYQNLLKPETHFGRRFFA